MLEMQRSSHATQLLKGGSGGAQTGRSSSAGCQGRFQDSSRSGQRTSRKNYPGEIPLLHAQRRQRTPIHTEESHGRGVPLT